MKEDHTTYMHSSTTSITSINRDSNMELLRIVAMAMIIFSHFIVFGIWNGTETLSQQDVTIDTYFQVFASAFMVVGVNLFVLISGYYGIRLRWRNLIAFCAMCIFYNIASYATDIIITGNFSMKGIIKCFLISKTINWFFRAYFILMLLSPILNKAIESFNLRVLRHSIIILFIINCVSGFFLKNANESGYTAWQLVFIYMLGNYVKREKWMNKPHKWMYMSAYITLSCILGIIGISMLKYCDTTLVWLLRYNNPIIVLSSLSLFLYFRGIKVQSKVINSVANTVVVALFIQQIVDFWIYPYTIEVYKQYGSSPQLFLTILLLSTSIFILAYFVEHIRKIVETLLFDRLKISNKLIINS